VLTQRLRTRRTPGHTQRMRNTSALQPMKSIFLPGLALLLSLTSTTLAQENQELGRMWTFENPPLAYLEEEYGFKPDQEWLNSLRLAESVHEFEVFSYTTFLRKSGLHGVVHRPGDKQESWI
jgi:hypothetical protein